MFDLSWTEILVIGVAAIIFIGPKELPGALRTLGQWTAKARALAREFQNNVDDMVRESELDKIKSQVDQVSSGDLSRAIEQHIDPKGELNKALTSPELSLENAAPNSAADMGGSPHVPAQLPAETPRETSPADAPKPDDAPKPA
jgi:sec-independent protein translocase protein TatB